MSIYFNSKSGGIVGQTGQMGAVVQNLQARQQRDELWLGGSSSMFGYCETQGYNTDKVLNYIENDIGYQKGSLSWSRSIVANDNDNAVLFQDNNGAFAEIDFGKNNFAIKSEKNIVEEAGLKTSQYDKLDIDQFGFTFYKFLNTGYGDGQVDYTGFFRQKMDNLRWGLTSVLFTESNYSQVYNV